MGRLVLKAMPRRGLVRAYKDGEKHVPVLTEVRPALVLAARGICIAVAHAPFVHLLDGTAELLRHKQHRDHVELLEEREGEPIPAMRDKRLPVEVVPVAQHGTMC
jgi:hypothetical protein